MPIPEIINTNISQKDIFCFGSYGTSGKKILFMKENIKNSKIQIGITKSFISRKKYVNITISAVSEWLVPYGFNRSFLPQEGHSTLNFQAK